MLGRISGSGVGYFFGLTRPDANRAGAKAASAETSGARAEQASQRQQDAIEALNTMKNAVASQRQQRKAAAKAKVDRLKMELDNLRLMSGGDPKAIARRAAQIARELGAAAKEYASSGGSGMAAGNAPKAGEGADATAQAGAAAEAGAAEGDAGGAEAQANAEAAAAQADATAAQAGEKQQGADGKGEDQGDGKGAAATQAGKAEPGEKDKLSADEDAEKLAIETFQQMAADVARQGGEKKADSDFAAEVRRLLAIAKGIVAQQRRRAEMDQSRKDDEFDRLAKQVEEASAEVEESFSAAPEVPFAPVNIVV